MEEEDEAHDRNDLVQNGRGDLEAEKKFQVNLVSEETHPNGISYEELLVKKSKFHRGCKKKENSLVLLDCSVLDALMGKIYFAKEGGMCAKTK